MNLKELEHFDFFRKKINKSKLDHPKLHKTFKWVCRVSIAGLFIISFSSVSFLHDLNSSQIKETKEFYLMQNNYVLNNINNKNILDGYAMLLNAQYLTHSISTLENLFSTTEKILKDPTISYENKKFIKSSFYQQILIFDIHKDLKCDDYIACSIAKTQNNINYVARYKQELIERLNKIDSQKDNLTEVKQKSIK